MSTLSPRPSRPKDRYGFEIAIICALPLEADAIEALFDHHWDDEDTPFDKGPGDPNAYSTGVIGRHNVVLSYMPGMGIVNAAAVASNCGKSFPGIKLALVVGVCGVVPFKLNKDEIVLGDVIVSDGIVQYDFGRQLPDHLIRKDTLLDSLGRPNQEIRGVMAKLRSLRPRRQLSAKIAEYLEVLRQEPELRAEYPGITKDRLFEASYRHVEDQKSYKLPYAQSDESGLPPGKRVRLHVSGGGSPVREPQDQPVFHVPFLENPLFVGRDEVLMKLQSLLFERNSRKVALVGLGGIGKTQIALQLAYWIKEKKKDYSVFWVPALSPASFEQACVQIMDACDISTTNNNKLDAVESVRQYLSSKRAGKWLLVVDNTDDMQTVMGLKGADNGLYRSLPQSDQGQILFTTRYRKVAVSVAGRNILDVPAMDRDEARSYLEEALIQEMSPTDDEVMNHLLTLLAHLPLAITQAAAYLNENQISLTEYLQLFENTERDRIELLSTEFQDGTRYEQSQDPVATTWFISFNQIHKADELASRILMFLAFVEPKAVPQSMLPEGESQQQLARALGTLCGYRFLDRRGSSKVFDMHSLVHLATRSWVAENDSEKEQNQAAIARMGKVFPTDDWENRDVWRQFLPHAIKLLRCTEGDWSKELCKLGYWVGRCLLVDGRVTEAVKLLEHVVAVQETTLAESHPDRLASQHALARAYRANGQIKEAVKLLEHVVAVKETTLAESHPSRLSSQHELAMAYRANGQIKEAVKLLEDVVAIREKTLAESHPSRLSSQHELAGAYQANGQIKEAVKLLEDVVGISDKTLAESHPSRLASQHALAMAYRANGQIKEAVKLLEDVVAIREKTLAESHPDRLASQHALAGAYQANGQIKEAVKLLEHVVAIREKTLAESHPSRLASQHELAGAYEANGQTKEAVKLLEHVVAIRETTLAESHPDRLASQHSLAMAYQANGQIKEALKLLEDVVAIEEKTLAESHPDRLLSQHELAGAYRANGQVNEAVKLLEHVVAVKETTLAESHPSRLSSQHELAGAYQANGQIKEAVKLLEHVVAIREKTLAESHPDRLVSQHAVAVAYRANGQIKEAVKLLEHVVAVQEKTLAENHPDLLASQHALAGAYEANGQIKEAVKLLEHVVAVKETTLAESHPSRLASQYELAGAYEANGQTKEAVKLLEHVVAIQAEIWAEDDYRRQLSKDLLQHCYERLK
ncbi:Tetratricopeptide repeat [Fusarium oxysporum f. sp. vasinfectum]|nr:Tetratricopeptide repeat [Fusarium oxysporum f. sp. vasinfectum]